MMASPAIVGLVLMALLAGSTPAVEPALPTTEAEAVELGPLPAKLRERVEALLAELSQDDHQRRVTAELELIELGERITPFLLRRMRHGEPNERLAILAIEAQVTDPRAQPTLARVIVEDRHPVVRLEALRALGEFDDPALAIEHLQAALDSAGEEPVQTGEAERRHWNAAVALAMFGQDDGLNLLHDGLRSPDSVQRWQAVSALAQVNDSTTVRRMAPLMLSPDAGERGDVVLSLGRIDGLDAYLLMLSALSDDSPEVRWRAALALGARRNVRAILPLRRLLIKETDPKVKGHAEKALIKLEALL